MPETPIFNIPWTEDGDYVKDWPALSKAIAEAVEAACGIATSVPQVTPAGAMTQFAGDKAHIPAGWLVCDGAQYVADPNGLYYNLYKAISTRFGGGGSDSNGFPYFNVPNMSGRFPRGVVNDAGIGDGNKGGSDNAVVVNHTHSGSGTTASSGHHAHNAWSDSAGHHAHGANTNHPFVGGGAGGQTGLLYTGGQRDNYGVQGISVHGGGDHTHGIGIHGAGDHTHTFSVTTGNPTSGTDGTGKNVPSYMPMYYIIKI